MKEQIRQVINEDPLYAAWDDHERATLASTPDALIDRRGAELSDSAEALSRVIAALLDDVRGADAAAVRQRLATIPFAPPTYYGRNR